MYRKAEILYISQEVSMDEYQIIPLPLPDMEALETRAVLKKLSSANRYLAELKDVVSSIPNEAILINTLALQEAKHSSEIENIVTTNDELFKAELDIVNKRLTTKEVQNYTQALKPSFDTVRKSGIIRLSEILAIQKELEKNVAGFRKLPDSSKSKSDIVGAFRHRLLFLPPYSPDLNPIEKKWAQAKFLRQGWMENDLNKLFHDMSCIDFILN